MSIPELLKGKHSKKNAEEIIRLILEDHSRMDELMECFFGDDIRISQRAAWPLGMLSEKTPDLIRPYNPALINLVKKKDSSDTIVRNILRTWKEMEIEEENEGEVFDACYELMIDFKKAIAIRAFSMYVCTNICCKYPELAVELIPEIQLNITHDSPAIRNSAKHCLRRLHKLPK